MPNSSNRKKKNQGDMPVTNAYVGSSSNQCTSISLSLSRASLDTPLKIEIQSPLEPLWTLINQRSSQDRRKYSYLIDSTSSPKDP